MIINKNSWHYRLIELTQSERSPMPRSLCAYFWTLMLRLLFVGVILPIGAVFMGTVLLTAVYGMFNPYAFDGAVLLYIMGWSITGVVAAAFARRKYDEEADSLLLYPLWGGREYKEPSLLAQYIEDKKEKVCPMVEYE